MGRRFFIRLLLATLGMVFIGLTTCLGLGWIVMTEQDWFTLRVGQSRFERLWKTYSHIMASLLPSDTDGDGVCDGFEIFDRTDSKHPLDHRTLMFSIFDNTFHGSNSESDTGQYVGSDLMPQPGSRYSVKGCVSYYHPHARPEPPEFPRDFRLRIAAPEGVSLALPGEKLIASKLVVPVSKHGSVVFDLQVSANEPADWRHRRETKFFNAVTSEQLPVGAPVNDVLRFRVARTLPAINVSIDLPPGEADLGYIAILREIDDQCVLYLHWPAPPAEIDHVLLEGARGEEGAPWRPVHIYPREVTKAELLISPASFPGML